MNGRTPSHESLLGRVASLERENAELNRQLERCRDEPPRLVHELQVHQLELEAQNQALRETQSALELSRNRYAALYDLAPVAYCTLDPRGVLTELNLTAATMPGVERHVAVGRPLSSFARMSDPAAFRDHVERTLRGGGPVRTEISLVTVRGALEVEAVSVPVVGPDSQAVACRTAFLDIGPRARAERERAAAHESERALRRLLEALDRASLAVGRALALVPGSDLGPVLDVVVQEARSLVDAEVAVIELTRAAGRALSGSPARASSGEVVEARSMPMVRRALELARASGRPIRWHASPVLPGSIRCTLAVPVTVGGRALGALCLVDKRDAEEFDGRDERALVMLVERAALSMEVARARELEAREHTKTRFLAQLGSALAETIDDPGLLEIIVRMNVPANADLCTIALTGAELQDHACHADDAHVTALALRLHGFGPLWASWRQEALATGGPVLRAAVELERDVPDATARALVRELGVGSTLTVPLSARGQVIGLIELAMLGEGRRLEHEDIPLARELGHHVSLAIDNARLYRRAQRAIAARDEVLAVVAHDLRAPLHAASLGLGLLSERSQGPESRRAQQLVHKSILRAEQLIADLLDVTRIETGRMVLALRPVAMSEVVAEAVESVTLQAERAGVAVEVAALQPDLPPVMADPDRLAQVFANIMGNAIKFTPPGGHVSVRTERIDDEVRVSVVDTGSGIEPGHLEHLFDRFWQRSAADGRGVGLGLWIARGIVEAHGGRIWAESQRGRGTTVHGSLLGALSMDERGPDIVHGGCPSRHERMNGRHRTPSSPRRDLRREPGVDRDRRDVGVSKIPGAGAPEGGAELGDEVAARAHATSIRRALPHWMRMSARGPSW